MPFTDDLTAEIDAIFQSQWTVREGRGVPEPEGVALDNDGVVIDAAVLYADLAGSTAMVDAFPAATAAEIYKAYLLGCARAIRHWGGSITAYDGDRIMGVFIGAGKESRAVKCGLSINYIVTDIVNPAYVRQYGGSAPVKQVVGIDKSEMLVARTGVRGDNDLVWVGRAANYAAKLTEESHTTPTWITGAVFAALDHSALYSRDNQDMWKRWLWTNMGQMAVYSSSYRWILG